jgi:replication factor C subunit 3/5
MCVGSGDGKNARSHRHSFFDAPLLPQKNTRTTQVAAGDMPHTLFYGPPGAGKTTLMKATLRELYGPGVERVKVETTPWKVTTPSRTVDVELTTLSSNYHVELTPADAGNMDR